MSAATVKSQPFFSLKYMVESSLTNGIIVHHFTDPIALEDLMSAKSFVDQNFSESNPGCAVLWDLLEAPTGLPSESIAVFAGFVMNPNTRNQNRRAFLAKSPRMIDQLSSVLNEKTIPWPWAVFYEKDTAMVWLNS